MTGLEFISFGAHIGLNTEAPTCLKQGQYPHIAVRRVSEQLAGRDMNCAPAKNN